MADPIAASVDRQTTYATDDSSTLRHRTPASEPAHLMVKDHAVPVVPVVLESPATPTHIPGQYIDDDYYSSDEDPSLGAVAKDAAVAARNAVGSIASAATNLFTNAARRVSWNNGPPAHVTELAAAADAPPLLTTTQQAPVIVVPPTTTSYVAPTTTTTTTTTFADTKPLDRAVETAQVGTAAAQDNFNTAYESAAARTASVPETVRSVASNAALTAQEYAHQAAVTAQNLAGNVVESTRATVVAPVTETAREITENAQLQESYQVGTTAAQESYSDAYQAAAAKTANLPHVVENAAHAAAVTAQNVLESTRATVAPVALKAREVGATAAVIAEDVAHKAADTTTIVVDRTLDTTRAAAATTSEIVSPAAQVTRDNTLTSYHQSEEATRLALERGAEKAIEVGTTVKVLATDALHKVESVGATAYHKVADTASGALHTTQNVAHRAATTASGAGSRAVEATAPVRSATSHVAAAAVNTTTNAGLAVAGAAVVVGQGVIDAATAIGHGVVNTATSIGQGATHAGHVVVNTTTHAGQAVIGTTTNALHTVADKTMGAATAARNLVVTPATNTTTTHPTTTTTTSTEVDSTLLVVDAESVMLIEETIEIEEHVVPTPGIASRAVGATKNAANTVANGAVSAAQTVAAVPGAIAHGVADAAAAVGHGVYNTAANVGNAVSGTAASAADSARNLMPATTGATEGPSMTTRALDATKAAGTSVANTVGSAASTVASVPGAVINSASNAASNAAAAVGSAARSAAALPSAAVASATSLLPGSTTTKSNDKDFKPVMVEETGAVIDHPYHQGILDPSLPEFGTPTPLDELVYAQEVERERRDRPGATGRQFLTHSHQEAKAFAEGIREHLGESGSIPALGVPRRELIREAEEEERLERVNASDTQRSVAARQAQAFSEGLTDSGNADKFHSAADIARYRQLDSAMESERDARVQSNLDPSTSRSVAQALKSGIVDEGSSPALNIAKREYTRSAEEVARDERSSDSTLARDKASTVASLLQAGIAGSSSTPAASIAKRGQIRTMEDTEREERLKEGWMHQPHAHDEARIVKEGLDAGIELKHPSGFQLNQTRQAEETERERRLNNDTIHDSSPTAAALKSGLSNLQGSTAAPPAIHIAEREVTRSQEEDERLDRMTSNDSLRAMGSPTQVAFALRAGLLRDEANPAVDVARQSAGEDVLCGVHGIKPAGKVPAAGQGRNVFEESKNEKREFNVPSTVAYQDFGHHSTTTGLLGQTTLASARSSTDNYGTDRVDLAPETGGRRSPPSTPLPTQKHISGPFDISSPASYDSLTKEESSTTKERPATPDRSESILIHDAPATSSTSSSDSIGLDTIRPAPSSDAAAVPISTPRSSSPTRDSTSSSGSRHFSGEKPSKVHAIFEKAVGKVETTIGKVVHSEHLIVKGSERRASGVEELAAVKERRVSTSGGNSP